LSALCVFQLLTQIPGCRRASGVDGQKLATNFVTTAAWCAVQALAQQCYDFAIARLRWAAS
jgi:hypothetical protein